MAADLIDVVAQDWRPSRVDSREAIRWAVLKTAEQHNGTVHITGIREHLPAWVAAEQVGATVCLLVRRGYLQGTGKYAPNGGSASRNASKPAEVRRLVRPIPVEAVA